MDARALFSRYLIFMGLALLGNFFLPAYYGSAYPKALMPEPFTPPIKGQYTKGINQTQPKVVFIGDSVLFSLDNAAIAKGLGVTTYSIGIPGAGTAAWYLILKNIVLDAEHKPDYIVIPFHNTKLTVASLHTTGAYFQTLDDFAGRNEPLVAELAYAAQMTPLERFAEAYFPVYGARWELRSRLDDVTRYDLPAMFFNCPADCVNQNLDAAFDRQNVNLGGKKGNVENIYAPENMDFDGQIGKSFLPHIIELARANGIKIIFVRVKSLVYPDLRSEPPALRGYVESLKEYFAAQEGVAFVDLGHDERMLPAYFENDGVHFTPEGRIVFVEILSAALKPVIK